MITLKNTNYYLLVNKENGKSLHLDASSKNYEKEKIHLAACNENDLSQIWMAVEIAPDRYPGKFEIVHTISTLVITSEKDEVKLKFGSWKSNQLFYLERIHPKNYPN